MIPHLLVTVSLVSGACAESPTLTDGLTAYRANKVAEAEEIFSSLVADGQAPAAERAGAARELARIAWLIDGDPGAARRHLRRAAGLGEDICKTRLLSARILRESGQRRAVLGQGPRWLEACEDPQTRDDLRLQMIQARLDLAASQAGEASALPSAAVKDLSRLSEDGTDSLDGARARLQIGVLTADAERALKGWRDYFWLTRAEMPQALAGFRSTVFRDALRPEASVEARLALADLLVRAGFGETAERYAGRAGLAKRAADRPEWRRIAEYFRQRRNIRNATVRVYRTLARKKEVREGELDEVAKAAAGALMQAAGASGDPRRALLEHYGLFGTIGKTNGYPSIHMGHVAQDRREKVSQYGHDTGVRLIVLDNMLSNGFESWLWDGWAATGGWAVTGSWAGEDGGIVQVRPEYAKGPLRAWALLRNETALEEFIASYPAHAAEDTARLERTPVAYMRGLNDRLRLQAIDRIAAAARAGGGRNLRRAFLDEYYRAVVQHSIHLHEGRHVIDKRLAAAANKPMESMQLEYRAKLSELALSDYPRLALRNINSSNVGDRSNHGRANAAVLALYRKWIEDHAAQIIGYDPALPALVQIDRLTDNQIRAIARTADPMAGT